jgi:hypothetical protein
MARAGAEILLNLVSGTALEVRVSAGGQLLVIPVRAHQQPPVARAGAIHGRLLEQGSGRPIGGATVLLLDEQERVIGGALTDANGAFWSKKPGQEHRLQG